MASLAAQAAETKTAAAGARWSHVAGGHATGIYINNSLSPGEPVELRLMDPGHVKFYICGPTVYNHAHLGHARAYLTFDIIRGILEDYFGLEVTYVMNITDVDDKIILRGRQEFLYDRYVAEHATCNEQALADMREAQTRAVEKAQEQLAEAGDDANLAKLRRDQLVTAEEVLQRLQAVTAADQISDEDYQKMRADTRGSVGQLLDARHGAEVEDNDVFQRFARKFERSFARDMDGLNVRPPTVLTRVSEYVPEVVTFVQKIVERGYGYESNGSVYFDTERFKASGHWYRKLKPAAQGKDDSAAIAEGEGALATGAGDKRCPNDFALWKASKPGEPRWDSPWGKGRPGWHIECSAMGSAIFGETMDIHAGGVDLKFPHHDNELAQNEGCHGCNQSVNYFIHAGHLHIGGLKMSKSLKNFTLIHEALSNYSANQIRLLFLLNAWDKNMNFSADQLEETESLEGQFHEFFQNMKVVLRDQSLLPTKRWVGTVHGDESERRPEVQLWSQLTETRRAVDASLRQNFNTKQALLKLQALTKETNQYLKSAEVPQGYLLTDVTKYVARVLRAFGVVHRDFDSWLIDADSAALQVRLYGKGGASGASGDYESTVEPFVRIASGMRDRVRELAASGASKADLFELCDAVRTELGTIGVRLEDRPGQRTGWKFEDPEALRKQMEEEQAAKEASAKAKAARKQAAAAPQVVVAPQDMFRPGTPKTGAGPDGSALYSQWDDEGIPTHMADGTEVAKKKRKKLVKAHASQGKKYAKYLSKLQGSSKE